MENLLSCLKLQQEAYRKDRRESNLDQWRPLRVHEYTFVSPCFLKVYWKAGLESFPTVYDTPIGCHYRLKALELTFLVTSWPPGSTDPSDGRSTDPLSLSQLTPCQWAWGPRGSVDLHQEHYGSTGSRGAVGSVDQPFVGSDDQGGQLTGYHFGQWAPLIWTPLYLPLAGLLKLNWLTLTNVWPG